MLVSQLTWSCQDYMTILSTKLKVNTSSRFPHAGEFVGMRLGRQSD
jgi:hypothetical protein